MREGLTAFGKEIRKVRIENDLFALDVAKALGVSAAYLSNIERGRKAIPDGFVDRVIDALDLDADQADRLRGAAARSASEVTLYPKDEAQAEVAMALARRFNNDLSNDDLETLRKQFMED